MTFFLSVKNHLVAKKHMKRNLSIFVLILIHFRLIAQENTTVFGFKSGVNLSIFSASINSDPGFRPGFHLGMYIKHNVGSNAYFRPELYYSGQGQKDDYQSQPNGPSAGATTTKLSYLNVPL